MKRINVTSAITVTPTTKCASAYYDRRDDFLSARKKAMLMSP